MSQIQFHFMIRRITQNWRILTMASEIPENTRPFLFNFGRKKTAQRVILKAPLHQLAAPKGMQAWPKTNQGISGIWQAHSRTYRPAGLGKGCFLQEHQGKGSLGPLGHSLSPVFVHFRGLYSQKYSRSNTLE